MDDIEGRCPILQRVFAVNDLAGGIVKLQPTARDADLVQELELVKEVCRLILGEGVGRLPLCIADRHPDAARAAVSDLPYVGEVEERVIRGPEMLVICNNGLPIQIPLVADCDAH